MTVYLIAGAVIMAVIAGAVWLAYRLGGKKERLNVSEKTNVERERDAEIASKPDVDRPLSKMRPKN